MKNKDVVRLQQERLDGEEVAGQDPRGLGAQELAQVGPLRGAGPRPARRRMAAIEVAERRMPRLSNSPWIRRYPHRGFSLAKRRTRFLVWRSMAGLPGRRWGLLHFLLTRWRCHRRSVSGRTMNDRHVSLGRSLLAAARAFGRRPGRPVAGPDAARWPAGGGGRRSPDRLQPPCAPLESAAGR